MNIICVKFGTKYSSEFVNKLFTDLNSRDNFYCYTDDSNGLDKSIKVIPDMGRPTLKVWWNKLRMFDKNFPISGKTLFFDLDVKINSSPEYLNVCWNKITFIDSHWKVGKLYNRLSNYDVKMNSSMITWNADNPDVHKIWDHFNTGFRDYYLRKYKGIDRFIVHEDFEYETFSPQYIQSKKYQPDVDYKPIITTFEEMEVGIKDLI